MIFSASGPGEVDMKPEPAKLTVGDHLRSWRRRKGRSQLDLALDADTSQRHISFLESGRSQPSRDMLLKLAERLAVPLRARNAMLLAAGFAPLYSELSLDEPAMAEARAAVESLLKGQEPYPALAVDHHWNLVSANAAVPALLADVEDPALLQAPINVLRLSLHPRGLAPRIANLAEWREHLLDRLRSQIAATGDETLHTLFQELATYPTVGEGQEHTGREQCSTAGLFVPLQLATRDGLLSFFSTTTLFGTPRDVTLSELAIETFFPADEPTRRRLHSVLELRAKTPQDQHENRPWRDGKRSLADGRR